MPRTPAHDPPRDTLPLHRQIAGNLPRPLTSFVGRDDEIEAVRALIARDDVQLVTLTGPGGVGKTRLAIQVALGLGETFSDGATFVPLAPVRDPELVPAIVAQALDIRDIAARSVLDGLLGFLRDKHLLLVLDNLEHLPGVDPLAVELLEHCPALTILGTSRKRLGVSGEHVFPLHSLPANPAIVLFEQRAQAMDPDFAVTADLAPTVANVCKRLDGLPLAIELAAARVAVLPPHALLARIDQRLTLLNAGPRDAPERHRGMREAIAWSHDLLNLDEQVLFRRLGVFVDSFTLDAAGAVAGNGEDVLEGVALLEANSLLNLVPGTGVQPRFVMLETIREYALGRLMESDEGETIHQRHAAYYLEMADQTEMMWWLPEGVEKLDRLENELGNIRAALTWLDRIGDVASSLRLAGSLGALWNVRGYGREGRAWLERGLDNAQDVSTEVLALASRALSWVLYQQGDGSGALATAERALAHSRQTQDIPGTILGLTLCGVGAERSGDLDDAVAFQTQALELLETLDGVLWTRTAICGVLYQLGKVAMIQGEIDQAETWYARSLAQQQAFGPGFSHGSNPIEGLGDVARARGDNVLALQRYQAALQVAWNAHYMRGVAYELGGVAGALSTMRQDELAARLFGASEALHESIGLPFELDTLDVQRAFGLAEPWASAKPTYGKAQVLHEVLEHQTAPIRGTAMDPDAVRAWWAEGRTLALEDATAQALAAEPTLPPMIAAGGLSAREVEVLRLLVQGKTDAEIAADLYISSRTASHHVRHIYDKLGVSSRAAATAWALRHGLA